MKNGEMKQSKKLLEDIAGIAGNCLTVCPSHEGKSRLHLREQNKCGSGYMVVSHGILRQFPQESPLANGQILIDGQVLIRLLAGSMTNRRVQVVDGDAHVSVFGDILIQEGMNKGCVESLSSSDGWMVGSVLGLEHMWFEGCCTVFKEFDSRLSAHGWNRKAKEEINLQKDVQVSVQAFEQVRDFDSKLGSQLKIIDEGDGYSEWQWDCRIPFIRRLKKIMKELQAWLKVELREVRRNKRRQGDAEDEQAYSNIKRCRHKVRVMDLDQTGFTYSGTERVYDLVNHIGDVFRYFIVDTVDPGSTPDVANCGRELGEKFLSQGQR
ncbi:hypothetical protein F2Q68_00038683 [Brassica cretica]|uniref:Uncharacterized protein n=1 Tax=Brassica cretica TaxID=69181 RepID=A0A8S9MNF4_BRACR|nr:hypothetical protein F2Q68_00038683 [Brassica cretica]